jgi:putative chitinase
MKLAPTQISEAFECPLLRAENWAPSINAALPLFSIDTPKRIAAFLAQAAHETGGLRNIREIWGPTGAQRGYEGRADLGNTHPGDGYRFLGRGLFQITGRANYRLTGAGLALALHEPVPNFENDPQLLEAPKWAALSAALYWHNRHLNELADLGDFVTLTRRINGGLNGYASRVAYWESAREALGLGAS